MQAVLDVDAVDDALLEDLDPRGRETSALRRDADKRRRRRERERVLDRADDRNAVVALARALRVEDGNDVGAPVAEDTECRLPVVRVGGETLSEDQILGV